MQRHSQGLAVIADVKISSAIGTLGSYLPLFCELKSVGLLSGVHTLTFTSDDGSGEKEVHSSTITTAKIESKSKGSQFALYITTNSSVVIKMLFSSSNEMKDWATALGGPRGLPCTLRADSATPDTHQCALQTNTISSSFEANTGEEEEEEERTGDNSLTGVSPPNTTASIIQYDHSTRPTRNQVHTDQLREPTGTLLPRSALSSSPTKFGNASKLANQGADASQKSKIERSKSLPSPQMPNPIMKKAARYVTFSADNDDETAAGISTTTNRFAANLSDDEGDNITAPESTSSLGNGVSLSQPICSTHVAQPVNLHATQGPKQQRPSGSDWNAFLAKMNAPTA